MCLSLIELIRRISSFPFATAAEEICPVYPHLDSISGKKTEEIFRERDPKEWASPEFKVKSLMEKIIQEVVPGELVGCRGNCTGI